MLKLDSSAELIDDRAFPLYEVALLDMVACICNETEIERQVVDAGNLHGKELLSLEEMVQVGLGGNLQPSGSTGLKSISHFLLRMFIVPL